jgi:hypothetical protein
MFRISVSKDRAWPVDGQALSSRGEIRSIARRGADKLLSSAFTLGAEGSVAAGPVGRRPRLKRVHKMHADILS